MDRPVVNYAKDHVGSPPAIADPTEVAWRLAVDFNDEPQQFTELFEHFLTDVGGENVTALSIGQWGSAAYEVNRAPVGLLVDAAPRLPNVRTLFLGDMESEDCEISWIQHGDITPLLEAYPALTDLTVRGSAGLHLEPMSLPAMRRLVFESGGLPGSVVRAVGQSDLPSLVHLELWLGTDSYGGDATVDDLTEILAGTRLPAITHLGLRDAEIADEVADAVATAPVVARLDTLDLSMGMLTDDGARALLAGQPLTHLRALNLEHHYLSDEMMHRIRAELAGVDVNLEEQMDADNYFFVAVGE